MAKVTGPLMSMDASGAFASSMVFGKWKGRNTVRQYTTPSNPQSADQTVIRNMLRVTGAAQRWANLTTLKRSGETLTDKDELITRAPAGQAWNGFLVKSMIGAGEVQYAAAETAYAALSSPQKAAWDTAAAALTPAFPAVAQSVAGGGSGTAMVAGKAYFHYEYGLYVSGTAPIPTGTPPTYA